MNASGCVTRVEYDGKDLTIIGTAHVSQRSVDEVRRVIAEIRPDTVCVELDQGRLEALVNDKRYRNLNLARTVKEKRVLFLLASLALAAYQRRIGDRLGVRPGAELLAAVQCAEAVGAQLILADRDIQATLKRTWANISLLNKLRLAGSLLAAPLAAAEMSEDQIEKLKDRDTISELLSELSKMIPGLKEPLIDERDQYLASSLTTAPGNKVVAVVGAGHVDGILAHLGKAVDRESLERLPTRTALNHFVRWSIPIIILVSFAIGYVRSPSTDALFHMARAWILPTSIGCGLFAATAGAHVLTIASGLLTAPIAALNPLFGAGAVTALAENWLRRPTPDHCEAIPRSITSLGGWYQNPATRVLLTYLLSSLGASLGIIIGLIWVIALL